MNVYNTIRPLVSTAIQEGIGCYQEQLDGTDVDKIIPAAFGRWTFYIFDAADLKIERQYRFIAGLGLAWAFCTYKGLDQWTWVGDWGAAAFLPAAEVAIEYFTPKGDVSKATYTTEGDLRENKNFSIQQERIRFILMTVALVAQSCALAQLQCHRASIPAKPSLYYSVVSKLYGSLGDRYIKPLVEDGKKDQADNQHVQFLTVLAYDVAILYLNIWASTDVTRWITGESLEVSYKWEVLSLVGSSVAEGYLP